MRYPLKLAVALALALAEAGRRPTRRIQSAINHAPERETGNRVRFSYRKGQGVPGIDTHPLGKPARCRRAWQQCRRIKNASQPRKVKA